ncbi:MAG: RluA family pseudouridine synthase [Treponema sp.]|nr:RluA family pseudouridine synthase [Treponema sp.]
MPSFSFKVDTDTSPLRLDRYICEVLKLLSRSQIKARQLKAWINKKEVKLSRIVKQGDHIEMLWEDSPPVDIIPQDIPLEIIYEDEKCVVINKVQGMVVHPGAGNRQGTLANALYYRRLNKGLEKTESRNQRPGIVHRLDKDTSGVLIAAYNEETHAFLAEQFKERKVIKNYIAIVQGRPKETKGKIETFIARDTKDRRRFTVSAVGKNAVTFYKVIKTWGSYSLLLLRPRTGRTHQLRVHLRHLGYPILGDPVYGNTDKIFKDTSLMLHSKNLTITLPGETLERIFSSPVPERFSAVIEKLNRINKNG